MLSGADATLRVEAAFYEGTAAAGIDVEVGVGDVVIRLR